MSRRPRAWFRTADDGKVYLNLKFGTEVIEIEKVKPAIEVGKKGQRVAVIEGLKKAVAAVEVDH